MAHFTEASRAKHIPVLLHESIDTLELGAGKIFLDGTLGGGGHSAEVLRRFPSTPLGASPQVRIIGLDRDPGAVKRVKEKLGIETVEENFSDLDKVLENLDIPSVDAILLDLGISANQLEESGKGFSFQKNEPLDMRMSDKGFTAADILNSWDEHAIELILRGFGEEKYSRKIAREIVEKRSRSPFKTTFDLIKTVQEVKPRTFRDKIHPATKTFQALRIAVNEELSALESGLEKGFKALGPAGRFAVISFHSLEDRMVKNFFRDKVKEKTARQITKKPIVPSEEEKQVNPRSRSAKLRVIEKM